MMNRQTSENAPDADRPKPRRLALLAIILVATVVLIWSPIGLQTILEWGRWIMTQPVLIVGVILIQALLFTFALPGSAIFWMVAPFLPPILSVPILVTGSVLGALGAYTLSYRLGGDWRPRHGAWLIDLVARQSDFFTQCALRTLPGCPHWVVSYAGGILRLHLVPFVLAAIIGLSIKTGIYAPVAFGITSAAEAEEAFDLMTFAPLIVMVLFLFVGSMLRKKLSHTVTEDEPR